jgi:hypothetical protein
VTFLTAAAPNLTAVLASRPGAAGSGRGGVTASLKDFCPSTPATAPPAGPKAAVSASLPASHALHRGSTGAQPAARRLDW